MKVSENLEIILIAGKGHETIQDYGNKIINISDKKIINNSKVLKDTNNKKEINLNFNSRLIQNILKNDKLYKYEGVSIDSRNIKKNNLFISIKGKNKDGHQFVSQAYKKGALYCVVSKKNKNINNNKNIYVKNTYKFLKELAEQKRKLINSKYIAVTGSVGKTTVKAMIAKLLEKFDKTYSSPKSYNNKYGVPLSLTNMEKNHKFGVFEIGMSKSGEIDSLSKIVRPNLGIITNIAEAHIENFKNIKEIAKSKSEIINNIAQGGSIILNRDDNFYNYLSGIAKKKKIKVVSFGLNKSSDVYLISQKKYQNKKIVKLSVFDKVIFLKVKDINISNILCCLAVIKVLNLEISKIIKILENFDHLEGRGKIYNIKTGKKTYQLIDESYNANPYSVKNAIYRLSNIKVERLKKYLLLGDMLELGDKSNFYHKSLSKIINNSNIDKVFVYGKMVINTYKNLNKGKKGSILSNINDFDEVFSKVLNKNDYLMIKGSNATGLANLCASIIKKGKINAF